MRLAALARVARAMAEVTRDLALGRYPGFVTGGALPQGHIPVFVLHSAEPADFESKLRHLDANGYATLTVEEHFEVLIGTRAAPERGVCLTFDDGRASVWSVGVPLLRRHGLRASVFLVPGRVRWAADPRPAFDAPQAAPGNPAVLDAEAGPTPFLSWPEVAQASASGVLEFESHTLTHARVHVGPRVDGFLDPGARLGPGVMDVPWIRSGGEELLASEIPLGTPLLDSQPRMSEALRFLEDRAQADACAAHVDKHGGERFFARPDWRRELLRVVRARGPLRGRRETPEEREASQRHELAEARRLVERQTGRPVRHLCYPWHVAGPTARRLARETGYLTAYCGKVPGVPVTLPGGDPHAIARVGEDFLRLLPGAGRSSLARVVAAKWSRRVTGRA